MNPRFHQSDYENYVFAILKNNACSPISKYPSFVDASGWFEENECHSLMNGIFNNGLEIAFKMFIGSVSDIASMHFITDEPKRTNIVR